MDDEKIIELYFSRSEQALAETRTKYDKLCMKIANGILRNLQDSEECVSASYMKLWNTIPPTRPNTLRGYLCAIVRNTALTLYTRLNRYHCEELDECIPDNSTVEASYESKQLGSLINEYIGSVSKTNRAVFVSRYYFNMSISEIAEGIGISESAVKTRLSRMRAGLREFLEERGVEI